MCRASPLTGEHKNLETSQKRRPHWEKRPKVQNFNETANSCPLGPINQSDIIEGEHPCSKQMSTTARIGSLYSSTSILSSNGLIARNAYAARPKHEIDHDACR